MSDLKNNIETIVINLLNEKCTCKEQVTEFVNKQKAKYKMPNLSNHVILYVLRKLCVTHGYIFDKKYETILLKQNPKDNKIISVHKPKNEHFYKTPKYEILFICDNKN
jgi:hypothetical protein